MQPHTYTSWQLFPEVELPVEAAEQNSDCQGRREGYITVWKENSWQLLQTYLFLLPLTPD